MGASPARRQCRSMRPRSLVAPNATQKARPEDLVVAATAIAEASPFPRHRTKTPRKCPGGRRGRRGRPQRPGAVIRPGWPPERGGWALSGALSPRKTHIDRDPARPPVQAAPGSVRARPASRQDAPHRVRPVRDSTPPGARGTSTGDLRFPRIHALLPEDEERRLRFGAQTDCEAGHTNLETAQGATPRAVARRRPRDGAMVGEGGQRLAELLRRSDQLPDPWRLRTAS